MLQFDQVWRHRLRDPLVAKPAIVDGRVVWGRGTVLIAPGASSIEVDPSERRLSVLLAAGGGAPPAGSLSLFFKTVGDEWRQGQRAMAAIRLAFAPVPPLDENGAYRLFLAEQALDAGLEADVVLREFLIVDMAACRKYDPDQPRVPAGSGRASGQFGSKPAGGVPDVGRKEAPPSLTPNRGEATIQPVFFDPHHAETVQPPDASVFESPHQALTPKSGADILTALPFVLPLIPFVFTQRNEDDDDGPACPTMRPDRSPSGNLAGDAEEKRVALLINPGDPTPKRTPGQPLSVAMAYYLKTKSATGKVEYDDCKRTNAPSLIPGMRKGDLAEIKTAMSAWSIWQNFAQGKDGAGPRFDTQIQRQVAGVRLENKGRQIFYCVGTRENVDRLDERYASKGYNEVHFRVCR